MIISITLFGVILYFIIGYFQSKDDPFDNGENFDDQI